MKYVLYYFFLGLIFFLLLPIILITWEDDGMFSIQQGLREICKID